MKKSILISESLILDADLVLELDRALRVKIYSFQRIAESKAELIQENDFESYARQFTKEFKSLIASHIDEELEQVLKELHGIKVDYS